MPPDYSSINETMIFVTEDEICVNVSVMLDGLVESDETLHLQLATNDPAILLMQPNITEITIVNSDGKQ